GRRRRTCNPVWLEVFFLKQMNLRTLFLGFACFAGTAQAQFDLKGVVDLHVHCNPDSFPPRRIDAFEVAQLFKKEGARAFVIKSPHLPTSQLAYAVNKAVPGVTAYGAITLNRSVGGINPDAVDHFARVSGGFARIVWMPTEDSDTVARNSKPPRPSVSVSKDGKLLPEVVEVLNLIKKDNLTLATGHSTAPADPS